MKKHSSIAVVNMVAAARWDVTTVGPQRCRTTLQVADGVSRTKTDIHRLCALQFAIRDLLLLHCSIRVYADRTDNVD